MSFSWSSEQQAIFDAVERKGGHLVVVARAGTGKTTTILEAARMCVVAGERVALLAFNVSVKEELQTKAARFGLSSTEWIRTLNGFGWRELLDGYGGSKVGVDHHRVIRLLRTKEDRLMGDTLGEGGRKKLETSARKIVAFCKAFLVPFEPEAVLRMIATHKSAMSVELPRADLEAFATDLAWVLRRCAALDGTADLDDQVWQPVVAGLVRPQFDTVFVDEVQDLTRAQTELALRACKAGGRIVAIGDDRQAIYGFRGADVHVIQRIIERLDPTVLPLATTRRCPVSVVERASAIVSDFRSAPEAPPGSVKTIDADAFLDLVRPGDFVISRKNAPLLKACISLLRNGIRARILKDERLFAGLTGILKATRLDDSAKAADVRREVSELRDRELNELGDDADAQDVIDKFDCVSAMMSGCETMAAIKKAFARLFRGDEASVICSSTHRAKGLEADRVFLLGDTYRYFVDRQKADREDENLAYVAMTRAKQELYFVWGSTAIPVRRVEMTGQATLFGGAA